MYGLTERQKQMLDYLKKNKSGVSPTVREIADDLEMSSPSGVHRILTALKQRGHIDWLPKKSRSIMVKKNVD